MNFRDIEQLIEMLKDTDIAELEVEKAGIRIRLRKNPPGASPVVVEKTVQQAPPPAAQPAADAPPPAPATGGEDAPDGVVVVTSPIVGTFYRSPSPESDVYVEVGDVVKKGQVVCIIEAMKLMNEIEAEVGGKIAAILAENTQPVEFGQPIFHIEPM